jgi:phenylacetate-coenzyme A ligase PaaK-like adenylate-forming protein
LPAPLKREHLDAWQLERLRETVAYARSASPFYRSRPGWPSGALGSLDDIVHLPFTNPADLMRANPPLLALSQSEIARAVTLDTSGTSGPAKRLYFTAEDIESTIDFFHHGMAVFTRPGDRVAIAFPAGQPGGIADCLKTALLRLGAFPLQAPPASDSVALAGWMRAQIPDVAAGPPVPLLAACRHSLSNGAAPLRLRAMLLSADYVPGSLVRAITEASGAEVFEHWGMTETGYGGAVECPCHAGCHLRENELFVEVIDPGTGQRARSGELGEVVVSTLRRRSMPLLRYRTGDLARLVEEPCACGSVLRRLAGFAGRKGEGVTLPEGGKLTLPQLDEALFAVDGVTDFLAAFAMGEPPVLRLSIATPVTMCSPAVIEAVHAALASAPGIGGAISQGRLRVHAEFADAIVFRRSGKRRLLIEEG